jgi:hypothetical protein
MPFLHFLTASMVWWSEFLATDSEVQVRFPMLPDFLRSSGSGTGSTQLCEYNEELLERKSSGSSLENREHSCRDPSRWPLGTFYPQKLTKLLRKASVAQSVLFARGLRPWSLFCSYIFLYFSPPWNGVQPSPILLRPLLVFCPATNYDRLWWVWNSRWNAWHKKLKPAPVPVCPPLIPHDLTWAWTWATAVESQPQCHFVRPLSHLTWAWTWAIAVESRQLTARAMAQPRVGS